MASILELPTNFVSPGSRIWDSSLMPSIPFSNWEVAENHECGVHLLNDLRVDSYISPNLSKKPPEDAGDSEVRCIEWRYLMKELEGRRLANASLLDRFHEWKIPFEKVFRPSLGRVSIFLFPGTLYCQRGLSDEDKLNAPRFYRALEISAENPEGKEVWGSVEDCFYQANDQMVQPIVLVHLSSELAVLP